MMHGREKSDLGIVAMKSANKSVQADAELDGASGWGQGEREPDEQIPDAEPQRFAFPPSARVCPNDWTVYEREQKVIKQNGLRRCCTT